MTGPLLVNAETKSLTPRRPTGNAAEQAVGSEETFRSAVDAMEKFAGDLPPVANEERPDVAPEPIPDGDLEQRGTLVSLLAQIDQGRRALSPPPHTAGTPRTEAEAGPDKGHNGDKMARPALASLTREIRQTLWSGSDGAPAKSMPVSDDAMAAHVDTPRAAVGMPAMTQDAAFALRAMADSGGARGGPARVDLVSMRTDFQPAETVALDGQVRSLEPIRRGTGLAALSALSNPATGESDVDDAETLGDAKRATADEPKPSARRMSPDGDATASGNGAKSAPDGKASAAIDGRPVGKEPTSASEGKALDDNEAWRVADADAKTAVLGAAAAGERPARQVASAVTSALSDIRSDPGTDGRLHLRAGGAALKTIQIQLQPAHLGKLDVTMRMVNGQLAIHLVASEPETALSLQDDTEGLKTLLSKAGFSVDEASISFAVREPATQRTPLGPSANGGASSEGQANGGAAGEGAERFEHRGSSGRGGERPQQMQASPASAGTSADRADLGTATYL